MIRKLPFLLFLSLFLALPASAQGLTGFGVKGGATFATLRAEDDEGISSQTDFVLGVYGQIPASEFLTIQPEVLYARKGASLEGVEGAEDIEANFNLDYIEIPVLLKGNIPVEASVVPSVYAGPYVGFAINREITAEADGDEVSESLEDEISSTDFGVALGADLDFLVSGRTITLSGRYDLGLSNIADSEDDDADVKTGTFMVTLGVAL